MTITADERAWSPASAVGVAVLLSALWLALQATGLGAIPFHSKGEPREAIVVQDIVARGDWILPRRNGSEIVRKPPLFYWLGALLSHVLGRVDEATVRLPSALQSWVACLLLVVLATATSGARTAFFAGVVLLTSFEWMRAATTARVDMTLACGLTATFVGLCMFERRQRAAWLFLVYGGMIWAALAKGPVAVVLPVLFVVARTAWQRGARRLLLAYALALGLTLVFQTPAVIQAALHVGFGLALLVQLRGVGRLRPFTGLAAVACGAGAWYALATLRGGTDFFMTQIVAENFARFTGGAQALGGHQHSPVYLAGALLAGCLPWTLFLPAALVRAGAALRGAASAETIAALLWCAVIFAFYSLAESKRSVYLLPMYPALALLIGRFLADFTVRRCDAPASAAALSVLSGALAGLAALLAVAFAVEAAGFPVAGAATDFVPEGKRGAVAVAAAELAGRALPLAIWLAAASALALSAAALCRSAARTAGVVAFIATVCVLMMATQRLILPAVAVANTRQSFAAQLAHASAGRRLFARPSFDYATVFYSGGIPVFSGERLDQGPPLLFLRRDEWRRFDWRQRAAYQAVPDMSVAKQNNQVTYLLVERVRPAGGEGPAPARE